MKVFSYDSTGSKSLVDYENFTFSGGEEHIRFNAANFSDSIKIEIFERLTNSSKMVRLMIAVDALKRLTNENAPIELVIPYFPYARQDRVCVEGEALGAAVMANFINSLNFSKVTIWDAHSDVSPALINRVTNIEQISLLARCEELSQRLAKGELTLISPDAGASKKTIKISEKFNGVPEVIQAQKVRNLKTGEIVKTEIIGDVKGKSVLIADDICDGGRTFIELAKVLKSNGAVEISLFITHGIFSKGLDVFEGLIDKIYTTDSFKPANEFKNSNNISLQIIEM
ncbi:ribose-phosphate pyrophosphokinase [Pseudoalteromonas sp. NZS71_1]|uniref:ribose-phosphate diphosphokinase n=1 Tax=unclassified Pseudoalteromonas TaxID=194690 RepID=UPI0018CFE77B|nr:MULTISPECIES: ribose-phosphate diphosphokinase [unclassified Pseudoalteromonas]MBH0033959.1 ribose-phosphate pyrophosphokinase [Pseudoalteromonas sp. NZS71_1]MBH0087693.1 ribose-phosphate pyrophosphokinase [Pseudoalteromonas sp. NSLLW218]